MSNTIPFPGGQGTPPRSRMEYLVGQLLDTLPASSVKDIHQKYIANGIKVSLPMVYLVLVEVRRYAQYYGWTVPHVKRGAVRPEGCYFAVSVKRDNSFNFSEKERVHSRAGFLGTIESIASMAKSEAFALRTLAQYETRRRRERGLELVEDCEFIAKKARALLREITGTDGY